MKKIFTWYWDKLGCSKNGVVTFFSAAAFFIIPVIIIKPICERGVFIVIFILWALFSFSYPFICDHINKEKSNAKL